MKLSECLRKLIADNNSSYARLAERMGYKQPASVGNMVQRGDIKVSQLIKVCNELDYDIIIKPRGGNDRAERTMILDELPDRTDNRGRFKR